MQQLTRSLMPIGFSALTAFLLDLVVYAVIIGRHPANRLAYALFISLVPAIGSLIVMQFRKWNVVAIYAVLFLSVIILQAVLRMI